MNKQKIQPASAPLFAYAQFCDDIRHEAGHKVTLVGLYGTSLFLPTFPTLIPKLGVCLIVSNTVDEPWNSLSMRIENDNDVITTVHSKFPSIEIDNTNPLHDAAARQNLNMYTLLPPLAITSPGMLRVVVTIDGVESVAGKLRISLSVPQKA